MLCSGSDTALTRSIALQASKRPKTSGRVGPVSGHRTISSVLATSDEELRERVSLVLPGNKIIQPSGRPALVPFMPRALLLRIHNVVNDLGPDHYGVKASAIACVVIDMLWGPDKTLPPTKDRLGRQESTAGTIGDRMDSNLTAYKRLLKKYRKNTVARLDLLRSGELWIAERCHVLRCTS